MLENLRTFFHNLDRRVKVSIVGTGIQTWSQRLTLQYNQLYAQNLGANPVELGLLNSIGSTISSAVSIPLGWITEKYGVKKMVVLALGFAFMSATIYALAGTWWFLIPAFMLTGLIRIGALNDIIFITILKPKQRATVMGVSRVLWNICYLFAPLIAAFIVTTYGGINAQGIRPLYFVQVALVLTALLFVARKLQPLPRPSNRDDESMNSSTHKAGFIADLRKVFEGEKGLKRWILVRLIWQFNLTVAAPFIPLWKVDMKGATPAILGIAGATAVILCLLLQIPVGRMSDKAGRKKAYLLLRPLSYLGTILLILAPSPEYLILVGFLEGVSQVSFTPFVTMHWEMVPQEKRGRWYGIEGSMNAAAIPATLLGGFLWQQGFSIVVLLLPIFLEVLILIPIFITIPDTLGRSN